jgi:DNA-binding transcriptional LysR family regulator
LIDDLTVAPSQLEANVETIQITTDTLYAMLHASHPLATKKSVHLSDLRNEKWALDTASNAYGEMIVRECRARGFEPNIFGNCNGFEVVLAFVEAGRAVSVLPGLRVHRVKHYRGRVSMRRISPAVPRKILIAFRKGELRNPAIAAFVRELQGNVRRLET